MRRFPLLTLTVVFSLALAGAGVSAAFGDDPPPTVTVTVTETVDATVQGRGVEWWAARSQWNGKNSRVRGATIKRLKRKWRPTVDHAIAIAATVYGVSSWQMHRVASCESGHNPAARNGKYRGVFQEGPMFERGPFARFGVYDPYANALMAARTVAAEGWSQWECKP